MANTSSDYFVNKCITKVQDKITEHETLKPRKGESEAEKGTRHRFQREKNKIKTRNNDQDNDKALIRFYACGCLPLL